MSKETQMDLIQLCLIIQYGDQIHDNCHLLLKCYSICKKRFALPSSLAFKSHKQSRQGLFHNSVVALCADQYHRFWTLRTLINLPINRLLWLLLLCLFDFSMFSFLQVWWGNMSQRLKCSSQSWSTEPKVPPWSWNVSHWESTLIPMWLCFNRVLYICCRCHYSHFVIVISGPAVLLYMCSQNCIAFKGGF